MDLIFEIWIEFGVVNAKSQNSDLYFSNLKSDICFLKSVEHSLSSVI